MASGSLFNSQHLTAAHRTLNMGTKVRVTELQSGRSVVVQITDRGPYFRNRGIDLSYAAARKLGIVRRGVARVRVELLTDEAPLVTAFNNPSACWLPRALVE
jgi:rare lipoprotein A